MAKARETHVERAHRRISLLQAMVKRERDRVESNPTNVKNVEWGYIERGVTNADAKQQISKTFNELQIFLDLLSVAHMAACFETEALRRLSSIIGEVKKLAQDGRDFSQTWHAKLVREPSSFEGLFEIEKLVALPEAQRKLFKKIRDIRNGFAHDGACIESPDMSGEEALPVLLASLTAMK